MQYAQKLQVVSDSISEMTNSEVGFRAARAAREVPNAAEERTLTFVLERPEMWVRKVGAR